MGSAERIRGYVVWTRPTALEGEKVALQGMRVAGDRICV